jgi:hypothetical protein
MCHYIQVNSSARLSVSKIFYHNTLETVDSLIGHCVHKQVYCVIRSLK